MVELSPLISRSTIPIASYTITDLNVNAFSEKFPRSLASHSTSTRTWDDLDSTPVKSIGNCHALHGLCLIPWVDLDLLQSVYKFLWKEI